MKTFGIREFEAEVLYRRFRNLCNSLRFEAKKFALDHDLVFYGVAWDSKAIVEKAVAERDAEISELKAKIAGLEGRIQGMMESRDFGK